MNASDILPLLHQYVAFETIVNRDDQKKQCRDWLQQTFFFNTSLKIARGEVEGCPYLFLQHPSPSLLWFAHFDVVPGDAEQFSVRVDGDRALGRGVKDMKGAALPYLLAYRDARERGEAPPVSILLTSDEEIAGKTIPALLEEDLLGAVPVAYTPDTGDNRTIVTELKGAVWVELVCTGKGSHGSAPWTGMNAITILGKALLDLAEAFPAGTHSDWQITVTPTRIATNSMAFNMMPGEARCTLDIRYPPSLFPTEESALDAIRSHLPPSCTLQIIQRGVSMYTDPQHPAVQQCRRIAESVVGTAVEIGREHGSSDARTFGAKRIPAFLYGPEGGGLHTPHEWVSIPSMLHHYEIAARWFAELSAEK